MSHLVDEQTSLLGWLSTSCVAPTKQTVLGVAVRGQALSLTNSVDMEAMQSRPKVWAGETIGCRSEIDLGEQLKVSPEKHVWWVIRPHLWLVTHPCWSMVGEGRLGIPS